MSSFLSRARKHIKTKAKAPAKAKELYMHSYTIEVNVTKADDLGFLSSETFKENLFKACVASALNETPDDAEQEEKAKVFNSVSRTLKTHLLNAYEEVYQSTRKADQGLVNDMAKVLLKDANNPL